MANRPRLLFWGKMFQMQTDVDTADGGRSNAFH